MEHLPSWQRTLDWQLIYSTYGHGISLNTLYRRAAESPGPTVLVVRDTQHHVRVGRIQQDQAFGATWRR